jgi:S-DNA-T family DNA segregation ATPase FtsK/SpoIIIE
VLLVDDLDLFASTCPVEAEQLADLLAGSQGTGRAPRALVGSATTTGALMAHRGALTELRAGRTGLVLHPAERGADELFGTPLAETADPGPQRPGRGTLVVAGTALPLRVARP